MLQKYKKKQEKKFNPQIDIVIPQESLSFTKLPSHILQWQSFLSPTQFSILIYLISRVHKKYSYAFPSTKTASFECNVCENTFLKAITLFEQLNLIFVDRLHKNNRYYLKPPTDPELEIIDRYLPKMKDKFIEKSEHKMNKNQQGQFSFRKCSFISNKKITSNDEVIIKKEIKLKEENEVTAPHEMQYNLNSPNSNLMQQHKHDKNQAKTNKNNSVVDEKLNFKEKKQLDTLKAFGVNPKKAKEMVNKLDKSINVNDFIKYLFKDYAKGSQIVNKPGFLNYCFDNGVIELYQEHIHKRDYELESSTKTGTLYRKMNSLKDSLYKRAENHWISLSSKDKNKIKEYTVKASPDIMNFDFAEKTLETFYIDWIRKNSLGITEKTLRMLDEVDIHKVRNNFEAYSQMLSEINLCGFSIGIEF